MSTASTARLRRRHAEFVPKGPGIKGGGIAAIGIGAGFLGSIAVAIAFYAAGSGHLDARDPWYMLVSQLALWVGFLGAVVVASWRNGTHSLARDYGLSWPTWPDLKTGVAGGVLGRLPSAIILILIVIATNGFSTANAAGRQIDGLTPEGTAGWVVTGLFLVVGAPFVEELLFRGLIQGAFTRRVGATPAIFITAIIFSFAHVLNEGPFAPLVLLPRRTDPRVSPSPHRATGRRDGGPLDLQRHRPRPPAGPGLPLGIPPPRADTLLRRRSAMGTLR